jgi:hypothetical protein
MKGFAHSVALVLALGGCEQVKVNVNCETTAAPAVECTLQQTAGKSEVEVCWDFSLTCANGNKVTAPRTCQKVKDGGSAKVTVPGDKLEGVAKCGGDKPPVGALTNMTIDGKKSE